MDNQIDGIRDILGVPEYKDGLISKMPTLGDVLGIGNRTDAILKSGDIDDQLRKILKHYIDKMSPTWRDFCTALEKDSDFNVVRKKIEADHNSSKANELEHPGSKRRQPPSDDQQPPSIRPHLTQEAKTQSSNTPYQPKPATEPILSGEVNEPGPSGSKRSQLPSDDQYPQSKRPYSTTKDPTAPRAGMDEKIARSLDVLKKYREGLIDNMKSLGAVLDIKHQAKAILSRNGSIDDHLLEILDLYINEKCPTWRDFCTALNEHPCFNEVREKIEADHNSKRRPGVAANIKPDAGKQIRFAIITANENERKSAEYFMRAPMKECEISSFLQTYLLKNFNFSELFETDGISVEFIREMNETYSLVSVCGVLGVLTKCTNIGSTGPDESFDTCNALFQTAFAKNWCLQAVFLVGCCGCQDTKDLGTILIADKIHSYEGGVFEKGKYNLRKHEPLYRMDLKWVDTLTDQVKMSGKSKALDIQCLRRASFLSGCLMKDKNLAKELRDDLRIPFLGFEMEGTGACLIAKKFEIPPANVVFVVKGVSDRADTSKNELAPINFFSKKVQNVDEDSRQQMCTMMSLMIIFKAIKAEMADRQSEALGPS